MIFRLVFNLVILIFLFILHFGFMAALPIPFAQINILIISLVFILTLFGFRLAFYWALVFGFLLDTMSFMPFGVFLIIFSIMLLFANFLLNNFLTNRSLYSFWLLTMFAIIVYKVFLYSFSALIDFWGFVEITLKINKSFWMNEFYGLLMNLFMVTIVFYTVNFLSTRLKPAFLIRK